jgi:hypothetical protein
MSLARALSLTCAVAVGAAALWIARPGAPVVAAAAGAGHQSSTVKEQVDLALTVYNSNLALVRDVRELRLPAGEFDLHFGDIAATVNPATVHLRALGGSPLAVLEQNYEYDLLEPAKLLDKYVGRELTLVRTRTEGGTTRDEAVRATLVANNGGPIWRIGDEIVTGLDADHLRFPELPGNLFVRPTLVWRLAGGSGGVERVEAAYQAGGISWSADYVLTVSRDDTSAALDGWVTLANHSGTAFRRARLQLVAGELNRVRHAPHPDGVAMEMARSPAAEPAMQQETFNEYHLYTYGRRTTIANKETKQLSLLSAPRVPVTKEFVVQGGGGLYRGANHLGRSGRTSVQVLYRFRNEQSAGLGVPLPAGVLRVYQADSRGALQFAGEERIGHTPKDEEVSFRIGTAFDIVCERKQTSWEKLGDSLYEGAYEVVLRNRKASAVTVRVEEAIGASWQMLQASHTWTKPDAWSARFDVPVEAGGTATVKYKVRIRH